MNDRRARCGGSEWVMVAVLTVVVVCAAGCGKREDHRARRVERQVSESNVTAQTAAFAGTLARAADAAPRAAADGTEGYVASLEEQQKVLAALDYARTPEASLDTVSNMLAGVSSKDIMAVVVPLQKNCDYKDEETRAIMKVYEVVRARGTPGWAVLFCTLQLSRFALDSMTKEGYERGVAMLRESSLSVDATEMEKQTYVSIQLSLLNVLQWNPPEQLAQIERIECMVRDKLVEFPRQPLENMVLEKASCYYWLGRDDEARALIEGLYEQYKRGTLSPLTGAVFADGLEQCVQFYQRMAKANREIANKHAQGKAFWEE
ncbi:MAG: hypothetical protein N2595_03345 [bacterium]|nr:hypothetical protein [bacterium]